MNPLERRRRGFDWPAPRRRRRHFRWGRLFSWVFVLGALAVLTVREGGVHAFADDAEAVIEGRARVNDGDTLTIGPHRIRIYGIDAVELGQKCRAGGRETACGEEAKAALVELVEGETVICRKETHDKHGRVVARCEAGGQDVGEALVEAGWALAYRHHAEDYIAAEEDARAARRGVWATEFTPPREWRERNPRS